MKIFSKTFAKAQNTNAAS